MVGSGGGLRFAVRGEAMFVAAVGKRVEQVRCTLVMSHKVQLDTVGQPPRSEIDVPNMASLKAKKLRKLPQEKVLLEL